MMHKRQRGMTMISWMIILGLAGIQLIAAMRIVPVYLDYSSVKNIMEEVKADPRASGAGANILMSMIDKRLEINGIYDLTQNKDAFTYQKTKDGMNILLQYEVRRPIYGNLEFIAAFDHEVYIPGK